MKKRRRILIVDDARALAESLRDLLDMEGYSASVSDSVSKAMTYLEKETPDLIITDLVMPHVNGFEFIKQLRKDRFKDIPIIAISADFSGANVKEAKVVGADLFLSKPFDEEKLLSAVNHLMQTRHRRNK